ncbi:MAG: hypothetical protein OSB05_16125 [Akkermansiaceae bacterium]|nr:hypothetical protein [Akkermansiaceae bacterium]
MNPRYSGWDGKLPFLCHSYETAKAIRGEGEVDGAAIAESLSNDTDMQISAEGVNGTMKFEKLEDIGGVPCQKVSGTITMKVLTLPGFPANAKFSNSTITVDLSIAVPTDTTLGSVEQSMTMQISSTIAFSAQGNAAEVKADIMRSRTLKITRTHWECA